MCCFYHQQETIKKQHVSKRLCIQKWMQVEGEGGGRILGNQVELSNGGFSGRVFHEIFAILEKGKVRYTFYKMWIKKFQKCDFKERMFHNLITTYELSVMY